MKINVNFVYNNSTMFSQNAKAYCIENLLGLNSQKSKNTDPATEGVGEICPVPGQGTQCVHNSIQTIYDDFYSNKISIELCQSDLWHSFHRLGTEMIITKSGRRMFPAIRCKLHDLDPKAKYRIYLDFVQLDRHKYRYVYHSSKWMVSGTGDNMAKHQIYSHPDCPMEGSVLNSQIISFERLKLTNNDRSRAAQISLLSMQRFLPRLHVEKLAKDGSPIEHYVGSFLQTSFMAVTAYQNQEITRLKIARNPFAKGFRESGKNRSSLEAMIECYGLQLADHELNQRCQRSELKLGHDATILGPSPHISPQPANIPFTYPVSERLINVKRENSPESSIKPTYGSCYSLDFRQCAYDTCCSSVFNIHSPTIDTNSFKKLTVRQSPYSSNSLFSSFTVKPRLKVLPYNNS